MKETLRKNLRELQAQDKEFSIPEQCFSQLTIIWN